MRVVVCEVLSFCGGDVVPSARAGVVGVPRGKATALSVPLYCAVFPQALRGARIASPTAPGVRRKCEPALRDWTAIASKTIGSPIFLLDFSNSERL